MNISVLSLTFFLSWPESCADYFEKSYEIKQSQSRFKPFGISSCVFYGFQCQWFIAAVETDTKLCSYALLRFSYYFHISEDALWFPK